MIERDDYLGTTTIPEDPTHDLLLGLGNTFWRIRSHELHVLDAAGTLGERHSSINLANSHDLENILHCIFSHLLNDLL